MKLKPVYQAASMYVNGLSLPLPVVAQAGGSYVSGGTKAQWVEVLVDVPLAVTPGSNDTENKKQQEKLFTYRVPPGLEVKPGDILSVAFGTQLLGGIAIRLLATPPIDLPVEKIKDVEDVIHKDFFRDEYWQLMSRISQYYYTNLIDVIRTSLPPGLLARSQRRIRLTVKGAAVKIEQEGLLELRPKQGLTLVKTVTKNKLDSQLLYFYLFKVIENNFLTSTLALLHFQASVGKVYNSTANQILQILKEQTDGDYSVSFLARQVKGIYRGIKELLRQGLIESYLEPPRHTRPKLEKAVTLVGNASDIDLTPKQQYVLEVLRHWGGQMWQRDLLQKSSTSPGVLKTLENKGYVNIQEQEILRSEQSPIVVGDDAKNLTPAQALAVKAILNADGGSTLLLHGVTGSGKTEVYLQAIAPLLLQGKSALVLVPEIGLTPQLTDRFRARFGDRVNVYHSALSEGERYDTWRQMLTGSPQVVIGTRSAVFAPLPDLGLIILDEEHDSSFKQDSPTPTYHARTVAQWRSELENCPLVLGSATPSLETWVKIGGDYYLSLPQRVNARPLPPVSVVDMRSELQEGNRSIFSRSLQQALQELKQRNQQGILFIHRRGHSTFVSCRSCGYVMNCPNCDVSMAYHHPVDNEPQEMLRCHYCNFTQIHPRKCPDCTSPYLKYFGSGTQRIEQELNKQFPELRCIRFDSDTTRTKGAHRTLINKFASGEADLLIGTQMLTKGLDLPQVTLVGVVAADGLLHLSDYRASERAFQTLTQVAGRAGRGEEPGRVIVQTYTPEHPVIEAVKNHDYASFTAAELEQRQVLNYPPYGRLILLRLSSTDASTVEKTAIAIASALPEQEGLDILGPAPAGVMRVANRYRWQILLKFAASTLPQLPNWEEIRQLCPSSVSMTIDVDPLNTM